MTDGPSEAHVWIVRAGRHAETFEHGIEEGFCGIGWPEMSDLSILGDALDAELDAVYADLQAATVRSYRTQLHDFLAIRPGDRILMPNPAARQIAVGTVTGAYEHRPDLPPTANHIIPTSWRRTDVPRDRFGDLLRWIDRPLTVSRVPVNGADGLIDTMLRDDAPIRLGPSRGGALQDYLEQVSALVAAKDHAAVRVLIVDRAPEVLESLVGAEWEILSGAGMGMPAEVPWITIQQRGGAGTSSESVYVALLFAADGSAVYLSLNQSTDKIKHGLGALRKRALDIRTAAGLEDSGDPMELQSTVLRPRKYEAGNAFAIRYGAADVPGDGQLELDLRLMLGYLSDVLETGLAFDPEIEPMHLLFKWSADQEPQTLDAHRLVAERSGWVWWSKLGTGAVSTKRIARVREQLKKAIPTHAYLYGGGSLWRADLTDLTTDVDRVEADHLTDLFDPADSRLFVKLSNFEELEVAWAATRLVLANYPDPIFMSGALSNQTTPISVFERFVLPTEVVDVVAPPRATVLDLDWLRRETLWSAADLEEILTALDPAAGGKGQVILAGPPGTGKTWVAERLARYLTGDQPLQSQIVQFHPSYGYEEFVQGLRPVAKDGAVAFEVTDGVIVRMASDMEDTEAIWTLIIDELNRANIPRVFGELMYLLEYRDKGLPLQYSKDVFRLPENLRIIATMNTADRSVRSIDVALRRRFEVFECPADPKLLARYYEDGPGTTDVPALVDGFEKLNGKLTELIDRHHTIGQSFFMGATYDVARLHRTWRRQVFPLIEDYFFDQPDVVAEFTLAHFWPGA